MFKRLNLNSIRFGSRNNYRLKEKLASTLAAVALACGCAASLSACGNKNHAAKSPAPSASETTTASSENSLDSEIGDAGLTFKTIHSDILDMDITLPEQAKLLIKGSDDLPAMEGTSNSEEYQWKMGDVYYQVSIDRIMTEKCPSENSNLYNKLLEGQETNSDNFYKLGDNLGDTALFFYSDWDAVIGKINSNDCAVYGEIRAGEELIDLGLDGKAMVDGSYYDRNGIDDAKRKTIGPIVRAVAKHLMKSVDAAS